MLHTRKPKDLDQLPAVNKLTNGRLGLYIENGKGRYKLLEATHLGVVWQALRSVDLITTSVYSNSTPDFPREHVYGFYASIWRNSPVKLYTTIKHLSLKKMH